MDVASVPIYCIHLYSPGIYSIIHCAEYKKKWCCYRRHVLHAAKVGLGWKEYAELGLKTPAKDDRINRDNYTLYT